MSSYKTTTTLSRIEESGFSTGRRFRTGGREVGIRLTLPSGTEHRQRRKAPVSSKSGAQRWGEDRERVWYAELMNPAPLPEQKVAGADR
jgi:hypothetical protein